MPDDKLSAKEAAVLAQVRAALGNNRLAQAHTEATEPVAFTGQAAPGAAIQLVTLGRAARAPATDPAKRAAALMAAARAERERLQQQQRQLRVWVPVAFMSAAGLWALLWMWHRL
jgi:hypothetical protein